MFWTEAYPWVDLRVDEHRYPVAELRRVFEVARHQLFPFMAGMPKRDDPLGGLPKELTRTILQPRRRSGRAAAARGCDPLSRIAGEGAERSEAGEGVPPIAARPSPSRPCGSGPSLSRGAGEELAAAGEFSDCRRQVGEPRDDPIGAELFHRTVGIAIGDGDGRHAGGASDLDVGLAVADHHGAVRGAAGARDGVEQVPRIGLAEGQAVAAADAVEVLSQAERREHRSVARAGLLVQSPMR